MRNQALLNELIDLAEKRESKDILDLVNEAFSRIYKPTLVFIGVLLDKPSAMIEGHVAFRNEKASDSWAYCMKDQPCELVYHGGRVSIPCDVQKNFVKKAGSGLESFFGLPINHPTLGTIAHFAVYDAKPNHFDDLSQETITILSTLIEREFWKISSQRSSSLEDMFGELNLGIHWTDVASGEILKVNSYLEHRTELKSDSSMKSRIWELDSKLSEETFLADPVAREDSVRQTFDTVYQMNGRGVPVEVRAAILPADSLMPRHVLSVVSDITERLDKKQRLQSLIDALNEQQEQQKQFFAILGHELRTPIASMNMLLQDKVLPQAEIDEYLIETARNLLDVLEDLRYIMAPAKAKRVELKETELSSVVKTTTGALAGLLRRNGMKINVVTPEEAQLTCKLPSQVVRQVCTNLIKNAALHSKGSNIQIAVSGHKIGSDVVRYHIAVEDDGVGIQEEFAREMFSPFKRGATDADGTGLGLFIVKELVDSIGGTLTYAPSKLGGALFCVEIQATLVDDQQATRHSEAKLHGKRVLVAEDNVMLQKLTERMLVKMGAEVDVADDGLGALEKIEASTYDVVITDINMPRMNGYELAKALTERNFSGLILGCTAAQVGEETDLLLENGAHDVITKPITSEAIARATKLIM